MKYKPGGYVTLSQFSFMFGIFLSGVVSDPIDSEEEERSREMEKINKQFNSLY